MCGRFARYIDIGTLIEEFGLRLTEAPTDDAPRYNIAPTQQVAAICRSADGARRLRFFRWGLIPSWASDTAIGNKLINARSETVHQKPSFAGPLRTRRCLIPASGFFEWKKEGKGKQPYFITRRDGRPMAFAGLWDVSNGPQGTIESCTILTIAATPKVAELHDRMPVILSPSQYDLWLDTEVEDPGRIRRLFEPFPEEELRIYPVTSSVNTPQYEWEDCVVEINHR